MGTTRIRWVLALVGLLVAVGCGGSGGGGGSGDGSGFAIQRDLRDASYFYQIGRTVVGVGYEPTSNFVIGIIATSDASLSFFGPRTTDTVFSIEFGAFDLDRDGDFFDEPAFDAEAGSRGEFLREGERLLIDAVLDLPGDDLVLRNDGPLIRTEGTSALMQSAKELARTYAER